ncbi:MAG: D-alanyl-D-alanine carboxypeptidase/D-alanyl-D-alanine-endopeptidase, partial [Epsilonproteobacteria bacterium]
MKIIFWLYFLLSLMLYALPKGIETEIKKSPISKKELSIYIKEVGQGGKTIASLNAYKTRTPASVIKVFTTYAALLKLGFNYHWPTKFYYTGNIEDGVLEGDLLVKGFGDPSLNDDDLEQIVSYIEAEDISEITGNIVIDRSYFKVGDQDSSQFDKYTYSPYNAMPDAMMFNERVSTVCVTPNKYDVHKKTIDESYKVINNLQYVNKSCRGKYSWPSVKVDTSKAIPTVLLKGKISKRCGKRDICKVLTKPYKSFYYALKEKLKEKGIGVKGKLLLKNIPKNAHKMFTYYSKSLEEIIAKTSKKSNNLYARHLLLLLGAKVYGAPATVSKGKKALLYILKKEKALSKGLVRIDNGSGLSRTSKFSAKLLADILDNAYDKYGQRWMNTLSIAGIDGTIKKRFKNTALKNRAWMKTGTLRNVKNIGGYVKSKEGKLYTVVVFSETKKGQWRAAKLQNEIMKWLVSYKSNTKQSKKKQNKNIKKYKKSSILEKYYIQVGLFSKMPNKKYFKKIEALGFRYKVVDTGKYKVLIGAYAKKGKAGKDLT